MCSFMYCRPLSYTKILHVSKKSFFFCLQSKSRKNRMQDKEACCHLLFQGCGHHSSKKINMIRYIMRKTRVIPV